MTEDINQSNADSNDSDRGPVPEESKPADALSEEMKDSDPIINVNAGEKTTTEEQKSIPEIEPEISPEIIRARLKAEEEIPTEDKNLILQGIESGMTLWFKMGNYLNLALIVLGSTAVFCSLYITAFAGSCALSTHGTRILSFISALCLSCLSAFNLNNKGKGVRKGWRHMKDAFLKYKARKISLNELIKASHEAEEMLGYVDFQADSMKIAKPRDETRGI